MPDTKHPADVLADTLDDESYSAESRRAVAIDEAADMLRTIPALEAERDQLRRTLITAREALRLSSDWQPKDAARIVREAVAALDAALRRD